MPVFDSALAPVLARLDSRATLNEEERKAVLQLPHQQHTHAAGRYLVRAGEKPVRCYALLEGFPYRHKILADGARQIVGVHIPGDLIDLHTSVLDVSDENVQALTAVTVAAIPTAAVLDMIEAFPAVAKAILAEASVYAAIFSEWIANVGRRDSRSRMAHILCEFALRQEAAGLSSSDHFELPMTQEQLADALGLTSVHVNRTLKQLEKEGLIDRRRRSVWIADWSALTRAGDFRPTYLHLPARGASDLIAVA